MAVAGAALAAFALASVAASAVSVNNNRTTLYDLTAVALDGSRVSLASLRGNVSLVINVATFWGETRGNYEGLVQLQEHYRGQPFKILLFPDVGFPYPAKTQQNLEPFANEWIARYLSGAAHNCAALAPDPKNVTPGYPASRACVWNGTLDASRVLAFAKTSSTSAVPCGSAPVSAHDDEDPCGAASASCCPQNHKVFELLAAYLPGRIPWDWGGKYIVNKCGVPVVSKLVPNFQPFDGGNCSQAKNKNMCAGNICCDTKGLGFRPIIDKLLAEQQSADSCR
jgi:hypothetical protein